MKKLLILSVFCFDVSTSLHAWQAVNTPVVLPAEDTLQGVNVEEERARIKSAREAALEAYKKAVKDCYQQVVVSSCKMDAQQKKIEIDNDLRRQEVLLNNYQRQLRGEKALQRLDEKQSVDKQIEAEEFRKKDIRDNLLKQAKEEDRQKLRNYIDEVKEGVKMDQSEETKEKIKRDWAVLDNKELTDEEFDLVYKELNNYLACDSKKKNYFSYFDNEEQKLCRKLKKSKKNRVPKTSLKGRFGNMYSSLFKRKSPQSQTNKGGRKHKTQRRRNRKH